MGAPLPALPETNTCLQVVIPDSAEWRQLFLGTLLQLQNWYFYDVQNEEDAEDVVKRIMECSWLTTLGAEGCGSMSCDDVADCIENSEAVQLVLQDYVDANGQADVFNGTWKDDNFNFESGGVCDLDSLYGAVDVILEYLNLKAEDLFQQFEENTNIVEALGVAEDIPFFGVLLDALGSELATEYMEFLLDAVSENYLAEWTVELKDELECELYCFIRNGKGCEVSITDIARFFAEKAITDLANFQTIADIVTFAIAGTWNGPEYVYITMFVISGALQIDKLVAGKQFESFKRAVFGATPSQEHQFCPSCYPTINVPFDELSNDLFTVTWQQVADTQIAQPNLQSTAHGNPTPSAYLGYGQFGSSYGSGVRVWVNLLAPQDASNVSMDHYAINFTGGPTYRQQTLFDDQLNVLASFAESVPHPSGTWLTMSNATNLTNVSYIRSYAGFATSGGGATSANMQSYIDNIQLIP